MLQFNQDDMNVTGKIKIPLELFPKETIDALMRPNSAPVMRIYLEEVFIDEYGVTFETGAHTRGTAEFGFVCPDFVVVSKKED